MASNIIGPAQILAYALPLQRRGISNEKIGVFVAELLVGDRMSWIPKFLVQWGARVAGTFIRGRLRARRTPRGDGYGGGPRRGDGCQLRLV